MNINQACPRILEMLHSLFPFRGAHIPVALAWLFAGAAVAVAQTSLPNARVGTAYSYQITTSPAAPAGTVYGATGLPTGISINASSGLISGTPITAGTYNGTISLTDSGITDNFSVVLVVDPALGTPAITSATTASGTAGSAMSTYTVTASNSPTSFNIGTLPPGLTLGGSATAPTITGTPTTAGTYSISLSANNAIGTGGTTTLTVTIAPAGPVPAITSATTAATALNTAFTYNITASNSPVSFSAVGLPLGLSVNTTTGAITGTPTVGGVYNVTLSATNNNGTGPGKNLSLAVGPVAVITSASSASATVGKTFSFSLTASNSPSSFNVSGLPPGLSVNASTGGITGTPTTAGAFTVSTSANNATGTGASSTLTINVAAEGIVSTALVSGSGLVVGADIVHPNGNIYDQVLLTGTSATIMAEGTKVTRISFIDLNDDIVQVEFSGAGNVALTLENPTGPATPVKYSQPDVAYMKGHASITVTGANENSNLTVFTVGTATAVNQALFPAGTTYDGVADIGLISIATTDGRFGGIRAGNAGFFRTTGLTGISAPGVAVQGPVFIGDITADSNATGVMIFGSTTDVRITGGDLVQLNNRAVEVSGITRVNFTAGTKSSGATLPAQANRARLEQNGVDVTSQLVPP